MKHSVRIEIEKYWEGEMENERERKGKSKWSAGRKRRERKEKWIETLKNEIKMEND